MHTDVERRRRRTDNITQALRFQLEACRRDARLEGMILADSSGLCMAASGDPGSCEEVAARIAQVGAKVDTFDGVMFSASGSWDVSMRRFDACDSELYVCAIGGNPDHRDAELDRTIDGARRILAY